MCCHWNGYRSATAAWIQSLNVEALFAVKIIRRSHSKALNSWSKTLGAIRSIRGENFTPVGTHQWQNKNRWEKRAQNLSALHAIARRDKVVHMLEKCCVYTPTNWLQPIDSNSIVGPRNSTLHSRQPNVTRSTRLMGTLRAHVHNQTTQSLLIYMTM